MERLPEIDLDDIAGEYVSEALSNDPNIYLNMTDKRIAKDFQKYAEITLVDNPELYVEEEMDHEYARDNHQRIIESVSSRITAFAKQEAPSFKAG